MYTITAKVKITEQAWGLTFINGVAQTDNEQISKKLKAKGYDVVFDNTDVTPASPFSEMKKEELIAYAKNAEIDISKCKTNAAIIEAIEAFISDGGSDDTGAE